VCICFNLYTVRKFLCGIAQLDVGDVTIWYQSMKFFNMTLDGWPRYVTIWYQSSSFQTEPGWAEQVESEISQRIDFKVAKFQVTEHPW
jgi:hypothetical protein